MKKFYVYILTNYTNSVLYTGVTNDLTRRTIEHLQKINNGFAEHYNAYKLIFAEKYDYHADAFAREKAIKKWRREKKIKLIESINPTWADLFKE